MHRVHLVACRRGAGSVVTRCCVVSVVLVNRSCTWERAGVAEFTGHVALVDLWILVLLDVVLLRLRSVRLAHVSTLKRSVLDEVMIR